MLLLLSGDIRIPAAARTAAGTVGRRLWRTSGVSGRSSATGGRCARARAQVEVLPPVRWARVRRRFPNVPSEEISITLIRDGCFLSCPIYSVTVHGDGRVRFEGIADTAVLGVRESTIQRERAEQLIARFRAADFWSLRRRYRANVTDSAEYRLTVRAGSRTKTVIDYVGIEVGMPEVVSRLEDAVDEVAGTARWVAGEATAADAAEPPRR